MPAVRITRLGAVRSRGPGTLAGCASLLAVAAWLAPAARAEVSATAQAQTANAAFLATAIPPGPAAGVCLVDSGVDPNPDTSHVVARLALSGGDVGDASPVRHGTRLAMVMGAGRNGFGTVGLWPAVRVVSVRSAAASTGAVSVPGYVNGIKRCVKDAAAYGLRVIELALSSPEPLNAAEAATLLDAIATARDSGLNVVAGAGNTAGGAVGIPASQPGVLSVGGSEADGQRCASSAAGAALQAPGCGLDEAEPATGSPVAGASGTSQASALAAAALAALRTWRPELSPTEAEQELVGSARAAPGGRLLDVAAAFRRLGLGAVVEANQTAPTTPGSAGSDAPMAGSPLTTPSAALSRLIARARLPRPQVRVRAIRGYRGVLVSARNRPRGAATVVSAYRVTAKGRRRYITTRALRSRRVALRVTSWDELRIRFRDPGGARAPSSVVIVVHPRHRRMV